MRKSIEASLADAIGPISTPSQRTVVKGLFALAAAITVYNNPECAFNLTKNVAGAAVLAYGAKEAYGHFYPEKKKAKPEEPTQELTQKIG